MTSKLSCTTNWFSCLARLPAHPSRLQHGPMSNLSLPWFKDGVKMNRDSALFPWLAFLWQGELFFLCDPPSKCRLSSKWWFGYFQFCFWLKYEATIRYQNSILIKNNSNNNNNTTPPNFGVGRSYLWSLFSFIPRLRSWSFQSLTTLPPLPACILR